MGRSLVVLGLRCAAWSWTERRSRRGHTPEAEDQARPGRAGQHARLAGHGGTRLKGGQRGGRGRREVPVGGGWLRKDTSRVRGQGPRGGYLAIVWGTHHIPRYPIPARGIGLVWLRRARNRGRLKVGHHHQRHSYYDGQDGVAFPDGNTTTSTTEESPA